MPLIIQLHWVIKIHIGNDCTEYLFFFSCNYDISPFLAGALSEDPLFPKVQWPSPEMCPACHTVKDNREHRWNMAQVLPFLMSHFSSSSILIGTNNSVSDLK